MQAARTNVPPPYTAPPPSWREASAQDAIVPMAPPPRYEGIVRACDCEASANRIGAHADDRPMPTWDSVANISRAMQGQTVRDPQMANWTRAFRERLLGVDLIAQRVRVGPESFSGDEVFAMHTPRALACTSEMHVAIAEYYEAVDAFIMRLPSLLPMDGTQDARVDRAADTTTQRVAGVSDGGRQAVMRAMVSARALDVHLGTLPAPAWRPSALSMALSLLVGVGGMAGAFGLTPNAEDGHRPSNATMGLRMVISMLSFAPFIVLSTRRAYLDNSNSQAWQTLKWHIGNVQADLNRFAILAGIAVAATEDSDAAGPLLRS